jgi:hypothetical protein
MYVANYIHYIIINSGEVLVNNAFPFDNVHTRVYTILVKADVRKQKYCTQH